MEIGVIRSLVKEYYLKKLTKQKPLNIYSF